MVPGRDASSGSFIAGLVENMRGNLLEEKSREGINDRLFPLSSK